MAILELKNVKRIYQTKKVTTEALKGVNFSVEKGEFISIMGESGAGKTTLLNIIATLDRATSGTVVLNGQDTTSLKDSEISKFSELVSYWKSIRTRYREVRSKGLL